MKKTVLITGASSGIGKSFAEVFALEGYDLVIVARKEEKLLDIKEKLETQYCVSVEVISSDLTIKNSPEVIFRKLLGENKHIDILINNAGFGDFGELKNRDWSKQYSMIQLNIAAMVHMTKLFLKPMCEQGEGKILNVASTAAFQPGPLMSVYYGTKAFVLSFSEALSRELKGSGVTVTVLCPGPTKTGFEKAATLEKSKLFRTLKVATPEDVAVYGYQALMEGRTVAIHGLINRLLAFSIRLTPRSLVRQIVYKIQEKIRK
jgi:short-subunit dehydrogenase